MPRRTSHGRLFPTILSALALAAGTTGVAAAAQALPAGGEGAALVVDCDSGGDLQAAVDAALPGDTITVIGHCIGRFVIAKSLVLQGDGATVLDGDGAGRVVTIPGDALINRHQISLADLTVTGGSAFLGTGGPVPDGFGGGLANWGSHLTLDRVVVTGNSAVYTGGGIASAHEGMGGSLVLVDTRVDDNNAGIDGGGVWVAGADGRLLMVGGGAGANDAPDGGALRIKGTPATLSGVWLTGNMAGRGGAISASHGAPVLVSEASIVRNTADGSGGAVYSEANLTVRNSTVAANTATRGGGIYSNAPLSLEWSTVHGNHAQWGGGVWVGWDANTLRASILAANTSAAEGRDCQAAAYPFYSLGDNLVEDLRSCWLVPVASDTPPDLFGPVVGLEPLGEYGGNGESIPLIAGNPALDFVPAERCEVTTDQRGLVRPYGFGCDSGAFEVQPLGPPAAFEAIPILNALGLNHYPSGARVAVAVYEGGSAVWQGEAEVGPDGFGWVDLAPFDLATGHRIVVTNLDTGASRTTTVVPLTFDVYDHTRNLLRGTAQPGAEVVVFIEDQEGLLVEYRLITGDDGTWQVVTEFDLLSTHGASVRIPDDDGDTTLVHSPPLPWIWASLTHDLLDLYDWHADMTVSLAIPGLSGPLALAVEDGVATVDLAALGFDLQPGMAVTAVGVDSGIVKDLVTASGLVITAVDSDYDRVLGRSAPSERVQVTVVGEGGECALGVAADGSGAWEAIFAGPPCYFEVTPGVGAYAEVRDDDGDATSVAARFQAPLVARPTVSVDPTPLGTEVTVRAAFIDADVDDHHTAVVSWGDGSQSSGVVYPVPAGGGEGLVTASHSYGAPGMYAITVTVTDRHGLDGVAVYESLAVFVFSRGSVNAAGPIEGEGRPVVVHLSIQIAYQSLTGSFGISGPGAEPFRATDFTAAVLAYQKTAHVSGVGELAGRPGYGFRIDVAETAKGGTISIRFYAPGTDPHYDEPVLVLGGTVKGSVRVHIQR